MTDKQKLLDIIEKLGLKKVERQNRSQILYPSHDEYSDVSLDKGSQITIGSGEGYMGFMAVFDFDENENVIEHKVVE